MHQVYLQDICQIDFRYQGPHKFTIHYGWRINSERDFPQRSAGRNGLFAKSKQNGMEQRRNLLCLLCLSHTETIRNKLKDCLSDSSISINKFFDCLKLYLSMEGWFHDPNPKEEVNSARCTIAHTITLMKNVFPRLDGQGWMIPKVHGLTKFQHYMILFRSAIKFHGTVGENSHK